METTKRLLTAGEAADILQMPETRLARFAEASQIPHVRLPDGEVRFIEGNLWEWIGQLSQGNERGGRV